MLETRSLLHLFDPGYILKLFFTVMLISLVPLADLWGVLYIDEYIPRYILLAGITSTALLGLGITFYLIKRLIHSMRRQIRDGYYPGTSFFHLIGLLIAGFFLITPGVIGDVVGILLLIPAVRIAVVRPAARKMDTRFKELYEYLKLYEM
ncbi:MAG: FxsA family protein [Spirochaetaceae bacterium]